MLGKLLVLGPLVAVLVISIFRAAFIFKAPVEPTSCLEKIGHERIVVNDKILSRFIGALNIPTISYGYDKFDPAMLLNIIEHIRISYPRIHNASFITRELVSNYSLLYTIEGTDKSLRPYILTSHLDVVPVTRDKWSSDPFLAQLKEDNYIYARGTIDAKHLVMSMLEALEFMLENKFRPERSFYMIFGHDEELGGTNGTKIIVGILERRMKMRNWDKLEFILDEGSLITSTKVPGIDRNIAMVGVVEKGLITVKLSASGEVGHASMPPPRTAIARLSSALSKFDAYTMPSFMGSGPEKGLIEIFASYSSWPYKFIYANFWLFKPLFDYIFNQNPALNSLIRTSTAATVISGGTKENVLPDSAFALINHRVHPLQTTEEILEFDRKLINDPSIRVERHGIHKEPSPVAPYHDDCYAYQLLKHSILQVYPNTIVAPVIFLASTDSYWYTNLTDSIYKFSAILTKLEEFKRFHGHDERISVENYVNLINFFHHLIENSDAVKLDLKRKYLSDEL